MRRAALLSLALAAIVLTTPGAAPRAREGDLSLSLGYDGRLLIKVLDIEIQERATAGGFSANARLTSAGLLALVKHIHQWAQAEGRIAAGGPRPGVFETRKLDGKTRRRVRTVWDQRAVTVTAQPSYSNLGDPPPTPGQELAAADPLTTLVRLTLGGSRQSVCSRTYLLFDGKQLYALDFGPPADAALSDRDRKLGLVQPFSCSVRFREVAGFSRKPANKRNQGLDRPIRFDFARAGEHGPLLITGLHAPTPLGSASIELTRLQIDGAPPAPTS